MWSRIFLILIFIFYTSGNFAFAQEKHVKNDSARIYRNIESFSLRTNFTRFMYKLFFKPVLINTNKKSTGKTYKRLIQKPYSAFEGKIIRDIQIETLDPFGNSIGDTIKVSLNFLSKAGNKFHIKSQNLAIRNLLLIRKNQPFDSLLVKESERLVRSMGYIQDVSFFIKVTSKNSDSVDILIRELDIWSITSKISVSSSRFSINLSDKNFLGLGHEYKHSLTWNHNKDIYAYNTNYHIPNILNSYINTTLNYGSDEFGNLTRGFAISRPFFSPFAKWAAGISCSQLNRDSVYTGNLIPVKYRLKFNIQEYWAGNAIRIFKGNTEYKRTTNFISAVRFLRIRYLEKPIDLFNSDHFFANENFYLTSIGVSTRKYVQDKFIFNYGITEDIPIGKIYGITGGYQVRNNSGRLYLGVRYSFGTYYKWGYLSSNLEYGSYFRSSKPEQSVLNFSVNYFTGLLEIGKWKFRQFVKPQITIGIHPFSNDRLTINDGNGIDGFNSPDLSGTSRMLFTLQTQSYAPWNFIGFRFGPYLICSLGMLGDAKTGFKNSKIYSQIGLGVLIKNKNLVINTFQISVAFYPSIPGIGQNVFKLNSFKTNDFGFQDFEIGKPEPVQFR